MITTDFVAAGDVDATSSWLMSWTHNAAGGMDNYVLIGFSLQPAVTNSTIQHNSILPSVTYGVQECYLVAFRDLGHNDNLGTEFVYLLRNPPTGNQTIEVSILSSTTATVLHGSSVSYKGVGGIFNIFVNSQSSTSNPSIVAQSALGRKLVHFGSTAGGTFSGYSGNLLFRDSTDQQTFCMGDADGVSSKTFSWTSGAFSNAHIVVELIPESETGLVLFQTMGRGNRVTGGSSTLSTSYSHLHDYTKGNSTLAVVSAVASIGSTLLTTNWTVTFGGQEMSLWGTRSNTGADSDQGSGQASVQQALFYLRNPTVGDNTVSVQTSGAAVKRSLMSCSVVYENVESLVVAGGTQDYGATIAPLQAGRRAAVVVSNGLPLMRPTHHEIFRQGAQVFGVGDYMSMLDVAGLGGNVAVNHTATAEGPSFLDGVITPIVLKSSQGSFLPFFN